MGIVKALKIYIFLCLAMSTVLFFLVGNAHAYNWNTCDGDVVKWNSGSTTMYLNTISFPPGSSWDYAAQSAIAYWNNVKGSGFNFYIGRDSSNTVYHSNGVNQVFWTSDISGALAVTYTRSHCYWWFGYQRGIDEADVGFNVNYSWTLNGYSYNNPTGSPYEFKGVAIHELGHALGLNHEDRWIATMNAYYPNGGPLGYFQEWDPLADDRAGVRYIYPDGTTETDIAGSALKETGSGTADLVSSPAYAARGSAITIEHTMSNQSTSTQLFDVGFYLSTDQYINSYDIFQRWSPEIGQSYKV